MRGIEKDLSNYLKQSGKKISKESIINSIEDDSDELINTILKVILTEISTSTEKVPLDRVKVLFSYIQLVLELSNDVDRKTLIRKLSKMDLKIDCIKVENKRKFSDVKKAYAKLDSISEEIDNLKEQVADKETKKYDFMDFLIKETQNIQYLECVLMKLPNLANIRDKNNHSLFQNVVNDYISAVICGQQKLELYYSNVISLLLSQKKLLLLEQDKKNILFSLYKTINQIDKRREKNYKDKIEKIKRIVDALKEDTCKKETVEQMAQKYDIPVHFQRGLLEQVQLLRPSNKMEEDRPLVGDYTISIDGDNTIEIDDCLSCVKLPNGNYLLGVHISSVLGHFPYDSSIVKEAIHRNQSIYLPSKYQDVENDFQRIIPIFPYDFSADKGSLVEGKERLARSYYFELAKDGSIVDEKFLKTVVVNQKKTTYREIDSIFALGADNKPLLETVENLQAVSEILDCRYKTDYLYEEMKQLSNDYSELKVRKNGSENLIYNAMLLTGNRVADYFADKGYPCLYRVHEMQDSKLEKLRVLLNELSKKYKSDSYQQVYQSIKGIYPSGWYDISGHHMGLGVDHHCHCTSEIRRAADIVVEHALEVCYDKKPSDKELKLLEEDILQKASQINAKEEPIDWFVKEYKKTYQKRR